MPLSINSVNVWCRGASGLRQRLALGLHTWPADDEIGSRCGSACAWSRVLANADAASIIAARADQPFVSVDDLWRRARVPAASLVEIADADGFRSSLHLARREALWAIKALRDAPLPLFAAAAAREMAIVPEIVEPKVPLRSMTTGGKVVEDYGHVGLTLRGHPVAFLREDLRHPSIVTCAEAMASRDGRWLETAGLVLVRQMPGSANLTLAPIF
jgi:error-prone DNA polymerase